MDHIKSLIIATSIAFCLRFIQTRTTSDAIGSIVIYCASIIVDFRVEVVSSLIYSESKTQSIAWLDNSQLLFNKMRYVFAAFWRKNVESYTQLQCQTNGQPIYCSLYTFLKILILKRFLWRQESVGFTDNICHTIQKILLRLRSNDGWSTQAFFIVSTLLIVIRRVHLYLSIHSS